jgi:alkylation response protein AidB-like acyl-CoA dehydrogenase
MTAIDTTAVVPYQGITEEEFATWRRTAETVAAELAATALERDRANRNPVEEIRLLSESGLLGFATPKEFGGAGASLVQALQISRIIAAADGSLGQLIAYHYSNGVWSYILGTRRQWEYVARGVGEQGWFQAAVSNPRDPVIELSELGDGTYRISGRRTFVTGAPVADVLTVALWRGDRLVQLQLPTSREGLVFNDDWDNLGQRLTASGSLVFDDVTVYPDDFLVGLETYEGDRSLRDGLRFQFSQLIFVHFYLGIAEGALAAAAAHVREHGRPWPESHVGRAADDPYHLVLFGRLSANVAAGIALADAAALSFQAALERGPALTAEEWGLLAVQLDQAKSVATEASLDVTSSIFQATGARSTANRYGLDIYWRNVRTHTTHDPLPYRQREIGQFVLNGVLPTPLVFTPPVPEHEELAGQRRD